MRFFLEVLISGMLSGVMYSLVALGFVLIFKSSGVFNFAQGAMVLFSALTFVRLLEMQLTFWVALGLTLLTMIVLAVLIERIVLRPLVNQPLIILFMATIGLNFFLEGLAQGVWDNQVHGLDLGIEDVPSETIQRLTGITVSNFDLIAALIAGILVLGLSLFFYKTRLGQSLASRLRRPSSGPVGGHSVASHLGHYLGGGGHCGAGGWHAVGHPPGGAV